GQWRWPQHIRNVSVNRGETVVFVGPVPHWNPMPPPELARDAPVLDVAHPVIVNLRPALREEAHLVGERARLGRSGGRLVRRTRTRGDTSAFGSSLAHKAVGGAPTAAPQAGAPSPAPRRAAARGRSGGAPPPKPPAGAPTAAP